MNDKNSTLLPKKENEMNISYGNTRNSFSLYETKKIEKRTSKIINQENSKVPEFNKDKILFNCEKRNSNIFSKE